MGPAPQNGTRTTEAGRKAGLPPRRVAAALIRRDGKVLICQRRADQPMALKWEFPGGKIEAGETASDALVRELNEELGIDATVGDRVTRIRHTYRNGGVVDLQFFVVDTFQGDLETRVHKEFRWEFLEKLPEYDFLAADHGLVRDLADGKLL